MAREAEFSISYGVLLISVPALLVLLPLSLSVPERVVENVGNRTEQQRILFGYNVRIQNIPFVAALYFSDHEYPFCSGTILSVRWVLTTAGCMMDRPQNRSTRPQSHDTPIDRPRDMPPGTYNDSYQKIRVVVGTSFFLDPNTNYKPVPFTTAEVHKVERVYMPIGQDLSDMFHSDLEFKSNERFITTSLKEIFILNMALLQMAERIIFSDKIKPIPIFSSSVERNQKLWYKRISEEYSMRGLRLPPCIVTGWGFDPIGYEVPLPRSARYTRMMHVDHKHCAAALCANNSLDPKIGITPRIDSCFTSVHLGDTCPADEGAPLYCTWFRRSVVGIVTTSSLCGRYGMPSVIQRLWAGYKFFKRIMRADWPLPQMPDPVIEILDTKHGIKLPLE